MEVLLTRKEQQGKVTVKVCTPVRGFEQVWDKVLERFVLESGCGDLELEINDNNATPFVVGLRLRQALQDARGGAGVNYQEGQNHSFLEATARERANLLVDEGALQSSWVPRIV